MNYEIYTDGACSGNPGPGGWGVIVVDKIHDKVVRAASGREDRTTNNRMELTAILYALKNFGTHMDDFNCPVCYSDSSYAINTLGDWMFRWASNGWKKSNNMTPENLDIIQEYYDLWKNGLRISLVKVKGHSGVKWNEVVDDLAAGRITEEKIKEM